LQAALAKVDDTIPLVFVSGNHDLGASFRIVAKRACIIHNLLAAGAQVT
jgi:predicted MPP superfamily phosphohydrolase